MTKKLLSVLAAAIMLSSGLAIAQQAAPAAAEPKKFDGNSWLTLSKRDRVDAITVYIREAKKQNIGIKKTAVFYARKLDDFYANEKLRSQPVEQVLKTIAVMEYDWTVPGKNKDEIAQKWLGDDLYKKNKERLSKQK